MATIKELDERLDALKKKNREEEQALRKAIRKQKAQEDLKLARVLTISRLSLKF